MERLSIISILKETISHNKLLFTSVLIVATIFIIIDRFLIQRIIFSILDNITNIDKAKKYLIYLGIIYFISSILQILIDYKSANITDSLTNSLLTRMTNLVYDKYEEDLRGMEPQLLTTYFEKLNNSLLEIINSPGDSIAGIVSVPFGLNIDPPVA
mgnify:CR=1 FL=1